MVVLLLARGREKEQEEVEKVEEGSLPKIDDRCPIAFRTLLAGLHRGGCARTLGEVAEKARPAGVERAEAEKNTELRGEERARSMRWFFRSEIGIVREQKNLDDFSLSLSLNSLALEVFCLITIETKTRKNETKSLSARAPGTVRSRGRHPPRPGRVNALPRLPPGHALHQLRLLLDGSLLPRAPAPVLLGL